MANVLDTGLQMFGRLLVDIFLVVGLPLEALCSPIGAALFSWFPMTLLRSLIDYSKLLE